MIKMDGVVKNERSKVVSVGNWDAYVMRMCWVLRFQPQATAVQLPGEFPARVNKVRVYLTLK